MRCSRTFRILFLSLIRSSSVRHRLTTCGLTCGARACTPQQERNRDSGEDGQDQQGNERQREEDNEKIHPKQTSPQQTKQQGEKKECHHLATAPEADRCPHAVSNTLD